MLNAIYTAVYKTLKLSVVLMLFGICVFVIVKTYQWSDKSPVVDEKTFHIAWKDPNFDGILSDKDPFGEIIVTLDKLRTCNSVLTRKIITGDGNTELTATNQHDNPPAHYEYESSFRVPSYLLDGEYTVIWILEYRCSPLMATDPLRYTSNPLTFQIIKNAD